MEFQNKIHVVVDSIKRMETLVNKTFGKEFRNFFIDGRGKLVFNSKSIGNWDQIKEDLDYIDYKSDFASLDQSVKTSLIQLLNFLKENKISGLYYNTRYKTLLFPYCSVELSGFERENRFIVLSSTGFDKNNEEYNVIKRIAGLMLVAPIYNY